MIHSLFSPHLLAVVFLPFSSFILLLLFLLSPPPPHPLLSFHPSSCMPPHASFSPLSQSFISAPALSFPSPIRILSYFSAAFSLTLPLHALPQPYLCIDLSHPSPFRPSLPPSLCPHLLLCLSVPLPPSLAMPVGLWVVAGAAVCTISCCVSVGHTLYAASALLGHPASLTSRSGL